jgi:transposase
VAARVDTYTNTIDGFFGNFKVGARGAYRKISAKWLRSYLDEYAWRYNQRYRTRAMFHTLVDKAAVK